MNRLAGTVSIITGAASGIGAATARRLAAEGSAVVIGDLNVAGATAVAEELRATGATALAVPTDVSDEVQVAALVDTATTRLGPVGVFVNNAAILSPDHLGLDASAHEMTTEVWDRTFAVNVRGAMLGCKHAVSAFLAHGTGGVIVNTSSTAAFLGEDMLLAYGTSKGAIATLTRHVATRYGRDGIRCNAVLPGPVVTEQLAAAMSDEHIGILARNVTTPRLGSADDIAAAVAFLASDDAVYVNGAHLVVDGGWSVRAPHWADWRASAAPWREPATEAPA